MKFYFVCEAKYSGFAVAQIDGLSFSAPCAHKECRRRTVTRPKGSMLLHWLVDGYGTGASDVISDFVWPSGPKDLVVTDRVFKHIKGRLTGFRKAPAIKMVDDPVLHRPKKITSRTKPRVWLPYEGPKLHELIVSNYATYDARLSNRDRSIYCPLCKRLISSSGKGKPMIIHRKDWPKTDFFKIRGTYGMVFVTEQGRDVLKEGRFSNLSLHVYGRIID